MSRIYRYILVLFLLSWLPWSAESTAAQQPGCSRIDIPAQQAYTFSLAPGWTVKLSNDVRFMPGVGFSSDELWHVGVSGTATKLPLYPSEYSGQNIGTSAYIERVENRSASVAGILVICFEQFWTPTPTATNVPGAEGCGVWLIPNTSTTFSAPAIDLDVYSLEGVVQVWIGPDWLDIPIYTGVVNNTGYRWEAGFIEDLRSSPSTPNAKLLVCAASPEPTATNTATATATPGPGCDVYETESATFTWGSGAYVVWTLDGRPNPDSTDGKRTELSDQKYLNWFIWADGAVKYAWRNPTANDFFDGGFVSNNPGNPSIITSAYAYFIVGTPFGTPGSTVTICPPTATPTPGLTDTPTNTPTDGPSPTNTPTRTVTRTPRPTNTPIPSQSIATPTPTTCNSCARSATQLALQETEVAILQTIAAQGTHVVFPTPLPSSTPTYTPVPVTIQFADDEYAANEDDELVELVVTLSAPLAMPVSVDYSITDMGASAGLDYQRSSGVITFDPGETEQNITIPIIDDIALEQPELIRVDLGLRADPLQKAYEGLTLAPTSSVIVTIFDNDVDPWNLPGCWTGLAPEPSITVELTTTSRLWAFRGEEGYMLRNNIWTRIPEFGTGAFIIPASEVEIHTAPQYRSFAFIVCPIADPLQLTPTVIGGPQTPTLSFTLSAYIVREDALEVVITVQLAPPSTDVVTVDYHTIDGTATYPDDYNQVDDQLTFGPGEIVKQIPIAIVSDLLPEPDEQFSVVLSNPVNAAIEVPVTTVIIQSIDQVLEVKFDSTNFLYMVNEDAAFVSVQLELSAPAPQEVSVRVSLTEGSALYAVDYVGILEDVTQFEIGLETLVVTFAVGEQVKILQIGIVNDAVAESDEMFAITFSEPSPGIVLDEFPSSAIQIKDNDRIGGDGGGERWDVPPGCEVKIVEQPVSIIRLYRDSLVTPLNGNVSLAGDTVYTLIATQQYVIPEGNYLASPLLGGTVEVQLEVCPYFPVSDGRTSVALIQGYEPFRSASLFIAAGQTSVARLNTIPTADAINGPSDAQILPGATYQPASWVVVPTLEMTAFPESLPHRSAALVTTNLPAAVRLTIGWAWPIVQFVRLVTTIAMLWGLWRYVRIIVLRVRH